jgi:hypothetical protein
MVSIISRLIYLQNHTHRTPTAAIVGGSVGGLAVVIATIFLVLYVFRRRLQTPEEAPAFVVESPFILPAETSVSPFSTKTPIRQDALGMSKASTFGQGTVGTLVGNATLSVAQVGETEHPTPDTTSAQGGFTGEQINSMAQRLLRQNMPAPVVATVVESMISANTESSSTSRVGVAEGSGARSVHVPQADTPPPSYDYKASSPRP